MREILRKTEQLGYIKKQKTIWKFLKNFYPTSRGNIAGYHNYPSSYLY